jgi:hypothetical protein
MADRTCPGCGMNDNHPRHILVAEDGNQRAWHKDCHRGKSCEVCNTELAVLESAGHDPGIIGDELRHALLANADEVAAAVNGLSTEQLETAHRTVI